MIFNREGNTQHYSDRNLLTHRYIDNDIFKPSKMKRIFLISKVQNLYNESIDIHQTENIVDFAVFEIFFPIKKILYRDQRTITSLKWRSKMDRKIWTGSSRIPSLEHYQD